MIINHIQNGFRQGTSKTVLFVKVNVNNEVIYEFTT